MISSLDHIILAVDDLQDAEKNYKNIFHIPEGILGKNKDGWLFLGYPIESYIDK